MGQTQESRKLGESGGCETVAERENGIEIENEIENENENETGDQSMSYLRTEYRVRVVVETREIRQREDWTPVTRSRWVKTGIDTRSLHNYEDQRAQFNLYDITAAIVTQDNQTNLQESRA